MNHKPFFYGPSRFLLMVIAVFLAAFFLICGISVLDAKKPENRAKDVSAKIKWAFRGDEDLGHRTAEPLVLNTRAGRVAVFGNGYGSSRGEAVLMVLCDIDTKRPSGEKFHTKAMGENGIVASVTAIDENADGFADIIYAGDLKGNLWKLDINDDNAANWSFAVQTYYGDPQPLFTAKNDQGRVQPITAAVDVMRHCRGDLSGYLLLIGTGSDETRYPQQPSGNQTVYGLWDWQKEWERIDDNDNAGREKYFGAFTRPGLTGLVRLWGESHRFPGITNLTLLEQSVRETALVEEEEFVIMTNHRVDWWTPENNTGSHVGWFFDLPNPGERVLKKPVFRDGTALVITAIPGENPSAPWTSALYMLDARTGGESGYARFDLNRDGALDRGDLFTDARGQTRRPGGLILDFEAATMSELPGLLSLSDPDGRIIRTIPSTFRTSGKTYWYIPDYGW